ncbi:MAG: hypothetical protein R2877_02795 [Bdellovibrionota bacterium]
MYDQRSQEISREVTQSNPQALVAELLKSLGPDGYVVPSEHTPTSAPMAQPDIIDPTMEDDSGVGVDLKPRSKLSRPNVENTPGIAFNEQPQQAVVSPDNREWYEKPWVWGAIAGGALAAGLGLYFGGVLKFDSNKSTVRAVIP